MWALAEHVRRIERQEWQKKFGTEFTGYHEGRRIRFTWHERVVGHICCGDPYLDGHLRCRQIVQMDWVWLRGPKR